MLDREALGIFARRLLRNVQQARTWCQLIVDGRGYTRRSLRAPAPRYDSFDDLNAHRNRGALSVSATNCAATTKPLVRVLCWT